MFRNVVTLSIGIGLWALYILVGRVFGEDAAEDAAEAFVQIALVAGTIWIGLKVLGWMLDGGAVRVVRIAAFLFTRSWRSLARAWREGSEAGKRR